MLKSEDRKNMEQLFKEADSIISNTQDEKLKTLWNEIVRWKNDGSSEEHFYHEFVRIMMAMSLLNFTERLPFDSSRKSLLNMIAHTVNHVNDELSDKVFPVELLSLVLDDLDVKNTAIVYTNYEGIISYVYSQNIVLPVNLKGMNVKELFLDQEVFTHMQLFDLKDYVVTNVKYISGNVRVKAKSTHFKYAEGIAYVIKLDEK